MGVRHDHARFAVDIAADQIGRFPPHAGKLYQLLHCVRHHAPVLIPKHLCHGHDVPGLGLVQAAGTDVAAHLLRVRLGKGLQGGIPLEQGGGNHIHPGVGALRG